MVCFRGTANNDLARRKAGPSNAVVPCHITRHEVGVGAGPADSETHVQCTMITKHCAQFSGSRLQYWQSCEWIVFVRGKHGRNGLSGENLTPCVADTQSTFQKVRIPVEHM